MRREFGFALAARTGYGGPFFELKARGGADMQKTTAAAACAAAMMMLLPAGTGALAEIVAPGFVERSVTAPEADQFGREMTVQNWILCTTQAHAESIAKARAEGIEPALKVYDALKGSKACGLFPSMRVILRASLYQSPAEAKNATRVYRASVNLGAEWPIGFVVYGVIAQ
jgi:hypothetical protein